LDAISKNTGREYRYFLDIAAYHEYFLLQASFYEGIAMFRMIIYILAILFSSPAFAVDRWTTYTEVNDISGIAAYGDFVWCATPLPAPSSTSKISSWCIFHGELP
jgi:hypothetical protein